MIPIDIDHLGMVADLKRLGWLDSKIESVCGFSQGYVAQIRFGNVGNMAYIRAARLYNLWESEHLQIRTESLSS